MGNRQEAKDAKGLLLEPSEQLDDLARRVIGAAIEVHRHLGPGFAECVYEEALSVEFHLRRIPFVRQPAVEVTYKGVGVGQGRPDFIVGNGLIVEIKTVTALLGIHQAQVISYLKTCEQSLGLLLNFRETVMRRGIKRVVWTGRSDLHSEQKANHVNETHEAYNGLVVPGRDTAIPLEVVEEDLDAVA